MNTYLDLARLGKNEWWRYLLALVVIFFLWQIVGAIPTIFLLLWVHFDADPSTLLTPEAVFEGISPIPGFVALMLASWTFLLGIFLAVRFIHGRRFLTLITPAASLNWKRLWQGFGLWFLLVALMGVLEALLYPGRYVWTLEPRTFLPFLFLALVMIPIQTSAEELFFRAYLLQAFGLRTRNLWLLTFLSGFLFMLPHLLNPEARLDYWLMGLNYFAIGAMMAYVTLRDGRLELALGVHAANNLFTAIFANTVITVMPTPSMFTVMELDVEYSTAALLVGVFLFILAFWRSFRPEQILSPIETLPVEETRDGS